jgi:putative membrane protein
MFLFTAFTVAASLNYNKVVIALIGLVGSYAVPFLLSDNSGRVSILFAYTAIINIGVLIISFYKQWRSLYLSAFVFTWLMLLSLSGNAYKYEDFTPYFIFNLVTFLTFYIAFIFQKIHQEKELKEIDVVLFLSNSLLFFGMGVWYIYDYYTMENRTIMAMFTLVNALLHFGVAYYFHVKKFPSQGLKYLILVLALSFATLVIPIQFKGSWITVFWSAEAALLFWFGRHKNLLVYERISYAVMVLASISLLIDWVKAPNILDIVNPDKFIYLTPFGNALFINTLLYSAAFGFMAYTHHLTQLANKEIYKILSIILNILCVASLYFIFFREISILCDVRALQQTPNLTNNYVAWEALNNFKTIWRTVYSLLFVTIYTLLNIRVFKSKQLGEIQFGISTLLTFIFMTLGLYTFSELRESYLDNPQLSLWFLNVRYVGIVVFAIFCYTSYLLSRFLNLKEEMQKSLEFVLHLIILWVASSELLHWTELYRSASNYKLGLTILWGSYALFLVVLGIFKRKKHLRISGIVLIGFSILKLFLYDTTHLDALRKTIVFVILGFLVLVASFFYNKYTNKIEETDKSENNETTDNNVTN